MRGLRSWRIALERSTPDAAIPDPINALTICRSSRCQSAHVLRLGVVLAATVGFVAVVVASFVGNRPSLDQFLSVNGLAAVPETSTLIRARLRATYRGRVAGALIGAFLGAIAGAPPVGVRPRRRRDRRAGRCDGLDGSRTGLAVAELR